MTSEDLFSVAKKSVSPPARTQEMPAEKKPLSNVPEMSVSDLAQSLKRTLEDTFGRIRVRGELTGLKLAGSGHLYGDIKDVDANINIICWRGTMSKLSIKPEEGMDVIVTGRVSSYPKSSRYQIIIESMELAGEGALLKMLEERRKKLAAEGLFDESKKQPIPFLPTVIGVVTSPTGAVIRDIMHRLKDRFPRHVLVWPVSVQGEKAADQITEAINGFNSLDPNGTVPKPDLLIVARGGGSLEDLMAFNEENVVRAVANSTIPVISAVGHETDTTLIDYVADLRAPTPTGAAEKAVPMRINLMAQIAENQERLINASKRLIANQRNILEARASKLSDPKQLLETKSQRLDHLGEKLNHALTNGIHKRQKALSDTSSKIINPQHMITQKSQSLTYLAERFERGFLQTRQNHLNRLQSAQRLLESYSYERTLDRGFSVIYDQNNNIVTGAEKLQNDQEITIEFAKNDKLTAKVKK